MRDTALDGPIAAVMTHSPTTVAPGTFLAQAVELMAERKISELPVVDDRCKPLGLIDVTDLLAHEGNSSQSAQFSSPSESDGWRSKTLRFPNH